MATLAVTNDFSAGAAIVASEMNTNFSDVETFINSTPGVLQLTGGTVTGAVTLSNTLTVGANDVGYDVKLFGATSGAYMLWDESEDELHLIGGSLGVGTTAPNNSVSVGIATASPVPNVLKGLDVQYGTETKGGVQVNPSTGEVRMGAINSTGDYFLTLYADNTERVRIPASGTHTADLMIGQTSTYSVGGSSDGNTFINSANTKATYFRINNASEMVLNANGLAINRGDSGPENTLDVIGDLFVGDTSRAYAGTASYGGLCFPRGEIFFSNTNGQNQMYFMSNLTMNASGGLIAINTAVSAFAAVDNGTFVIQTAASATAGAAPSLVERFAIDNAGAVTIAGDFTVSGTKNFEIPHPIRGGNWRLRHSAIEAPRADLIYRGTATLSGGTATVDLDTDSDMTDGTWEALCTNPWAMVASSGNAVEWSLSGKTLTITSDTADAVCSWMVIGQRQDGRMVGGDCLTCDDDGHLIVEYEREDTSEANEAAAFEAGEALAEANAEAAAVAAEEAAAALAEANAEAAAAAA